MSSVSLEAREPVSDIVSPLSSECFEALTTCKLRVVADMLNCRMKALLFVLLRAFEYELAVDPALIGKKQGAVSRPYIPTQEEVGSQMPLFVRHYRR